MLTPKYTLRSFERLKSVKQIEKLFSQGKTQFNYPFKLFYIIENKNEDWPLKFSVSIPKKKVKSAVKRNLLKRRTREAYRLNKISLQNSILSKDYKVSLMFIYLEKEIKNYDVIEKSIVKHLNELSSKINLLD